MYGWYWGVCIRRTRRKRVVTDDDHRAPLLGEENHRIEVTSLRSSFNLHKWTSEMKETRERTIESYYVLGDRPTTLLKNGWQNERESSRDTRTHNLHPNHSIPTHIYICAYMYIYIQTHIYICIHTFKHIQGINPAAGRGLDTIYRYRRVNFNIFRSVLTARTNVTIVERDDTEHQFFRE